MPSLTTAWNDMLRGVVTHQPMGLPQGLPNMPSAPDMGKPTKP
jgi:hypothetical protein